jgi:hypothetical protein
LHKDTDEDWPTWMTRQLLEADFVLCVCTRTYNERFRGEGLPDVGRGAGWEGGLIRRLLYRRKLLNDRIVPVMLDRADGEFIPLELEGYDYFVLDRDEGYVSLLRKVHGVREFSRPVTGTAPELLTHEIQPSFGRPANHPVAPVDWRPQSPPAPSIGVSGHVMGQNVVIGGTQTIQGGLNFNSSEESAELAAASRTAQGLRSELQSLLAHACDLSTSTEDRRSQLRSASEDLLRELVNRPHNQERLAAQAERLRAIASGIDNLGIQENAARITAMIRTLY